MKKILLILLSILFINDLSYSLDSLKLRKVFDILEKFNNDPDQQKKNYLGYKIINSDSLNCIAIFTYIQRGDIVFKSTDGGFNWNLFLDCEKKSVFGQCYGQAFPTSNFESVN